MVLEVAHLNAHTHTPVAFMYERPNDAVFDLKLREKLCSTPLSSRDLLSQTIRTIECIVGTSKSSHQWWKLIASIDEQVDVYNSRTLLRRNHTKNPIPPHASP